MPFCAYQHVCTSVLNAVVIDHVRTYNAEDRYADEETPMTLLPDDLCIPAPIAEYSKFITDAMTPQGDTIRLNLPEAGIPIPHTAAVDNTPEMPAGTFGTVTAQTHNSYECYMSPYVTSQLVIATREQNQQHQFGPWEPLPATMIPNGAMPTENLLGYRANVERVNPEGMNAIMNIEFPTGQDMSSRLGWSPELVSRVSGTRKNMQGKYKMHIGRISPGKQPMALGWISAYNVPGNVNTGRISLVSGTIQSSVALGASQCNIVGLMGLKRQRHNLAPNVGGF